MSKFDMSLMKQIGDRFEKAVISLKSTSIRYLSTPSGVMRFIYQIVSGSLVAGATVSHLLMAIALPLLTLPSVAHSQIVTDPTAPLRFQPQLGTAGNLSISPRRTLLAYPTINIRISMSAKMG